MRDKLFYIFTVNSKIKEALPGLFHAGFIISPLLHDVFFQPGVITSGRILQSQPAWPFQAPL
jgi:hypothetical protein